MTELVKKRKVRREHRSYVKKLIGMTKELIASYEETAEAKLVLEEKKMHLDDAILNILCGDKDLEEEIDGEIEESENIKAEVQTLILRINSKLCLNIEGSLPSTSSAPQNSSSATVTANTKQVRLPTLEVPKFSGKVHEWQEFWDGFSSAIDGNTQLSEVDKFSYLRGLLLEPARSTIQGFALTADVITTLNFIFNY
ncbi:Hypothetical predicted protein [Paramuricea clavata]|uniref:Uncharacterized protein n=1 Tax=Paramuricea clavata TaxID=317549 RepID=A0A7D9IKX8_PARCT|nr:Hypothetical predicted protein [Paramuricea clavata]